MRNRLLLWLPILTALALASLGRWTGARRLDEFRGTGACVRPPRALGRLAGDLEADVGVHRLPNLQVKLDLAPLLLGVRCVGATDDQPLTVIGNGEARTVEMLPQFGDRRRVEQSKSHQAADLTSALRRGSSTAQTRGRSPIWPVLPNKARVSLVVSRGRRG